MDEFGCPAKTAANAVKLFPLAMAECGTIVSIPLPQNEGGFSFGVHGLSTQVGAAAGGEAEMLVGPALEDGLVDVYRQAGHGPTSALLEFSRISEMLIDPTQVNTFGVAPFKPHNGIEILNMGTQVARARVNLPENRTPIDYTLQPGEFVLIPAYSSPGGLSSYPWTIENLATGGDALHLGVQEWYAVDLAGIGDPSIVPVYSARLIRRGNFANDQCTFKVTGEDPSAGSELFVVVHSLGSPVLGVDGPRTGPGDLEPLRVLPAWPNPFRAHTRMAFDLSVAARLRVSIFDLQGRRVRAFADRTLPPGPFSLEWNGEDDSGRRLPSSVYFYRATRDGRDVGGGTLIRLK